MKNIGCFFRGFVLTSIMMSSVVIVTYWLKPIENTISNNQEIIHNDVVSHFDNEQG